MTFDEFVQQQGINRTGGAATTLKMSNSGNPADYLTPIRAERPLPELSSVMRSANLPINGGSDTGSNGGPSNIGPSAAEIAAAQAKIAAQNAAREKVNAGRGEVFTGAGEAAGEYLRQQQLEADKFGRQYKLNMQGLNNKYTDAEAGKMSAYSGIMDMINRGVTSAGTMLANKNASSSSAADAIARAYAMLGQREAQGVAQDYTTDIRDLGLELGALKASKDTFEQGVNTGVESKVAEIVGDARNKLISLNEIYADAGLSDRLQVEQLKEEIRGNANKALEGLLGYAQNTYKGVNPYTQQQRIGAANKLRESGGLGTAYDYTTQAPMGMASSNVNASSLPLYSNLRSNKKDR